MKKNSKKSKKTETPIISPKEEKLFDNLLKVTKQFMGSKSFTPLTKLSLMQRLSIAPQHEEIFQNILDHLLSSQVIECVDQRYAWKSAPTDTVTGSLHMHPRGFGFVQPDSPSEYTQDIFIPKHFTKNAVNGDRVEVIVNPDSNSPKGPEGKIITILSRARSHMAGIIRQIDKQGTFLAYVPLLGNEQRVVVEKSNDFSLKVGDRIVMEVIDWGSKETETIGRFSHYLGHISDPSCDTYAAIEEFELRPSFPPHVIEEAEKIGNRVSTKDMQGREDLRSLTTFTIDPDTAKDFDDALSLTQDENGIYHLGVHIADVSHYVQPGSAIDEEARLRCNSTYFPNYCLPMLPGVLSENLCSLRANVNRLTVSVLMRLDEEGTIIDYRIVRSVIKSAKRFTYREAKKVLDGIQKSSHASTLSMMVTVCQLLKKKRYERGSIEFSLPELVVIVDDKGMPYGTDYIAYDITHQMVEEFMLKANEIVAWDLTQRGFSLTYRVHEDPAEENLRDFSILANAFGFRVPDFPSSQDLQKLFEEAAGTTYSNYLATHYIRRMRLAIYSAENIGHYGLSLTHYCHFTSPIRRYIDLVIHRLLFEKQADFEYLQNIAQACSEQERISAKAESRVVVLKKLRLLDVMHKKDAYREYEAIVTKVKPFGVYFEMMELLLEGFLHISELGEDYFVYEETKMRLRGTRHGGFYAPGDRVTVMLQSVDFISQEAKWYLVANEHSVQAEAVSRRKEKPSRKKENPASKSKFEKTKKQTDKRSSPSRKETPKKITETKKKKIGREIT